MGFLPQYFLKNTELTEIQCEAGMDLPRETQLQLSFDGLRSLGLCKLKGGECISLSFRSVRLLFPDTVETKFGFEQGEGCQLKTDSAFLFC